MTVIGVDVELDDWVIANQTVARGQITLAGGNKQTVSLGSPVDGYVYDIHVAVGDVIESRLDVWMDIVEPEEQFTNLMEYNARDRDGDGLADGRQPTHWSPIQTATVSAMASKSWVGRSLSSTSESSASW